jgi:hypothetical protein
MATTPYRNESKTILVVDDDATIRSIVPSSWRVWGMFFWKLATERMG